MDPAFLNERRPAGPAGKWAKRVWIHLTKHVGIGIICSVAYFDPYVPFFTLPLYLKAHVQLFDTRGNWSVDLQAGSQFGYKLLFVVLLSGVFAVILQVVSFPRLSRC
jgi:metal iron transporter